MMPGTLERGRGGASQGVSCRWVLGTMDRVHVHSRGAQEVLSIDEVERRFGRAALEALYLQGRFVLEEKSGRSGA